MTGGLIYEAGSVAGDKICLGLVHNRYTGIINTKPKSQIKVNVYVKSQVFNLVNDVNSQKNLVYPTVIRLIQKAFLGVVGK